MKDANLCNNNFLSKAVNQCINKCSFPCADIAGKEKKPLVFLGCVSQRGKGLFVLFAKPEELWIRAYLKKRDGSLLCDSWMSYLLIIMTA